MQPSFKRQIAEAITAALEAGFREGPAITEFVQLAVPQATAADVETVAHEIIDHIAMMDVEGPGYSRTNERRPDHGVS